jgi:8-oxo-dGTP pyrophosphatase MutT (NUDIX family)
MTKIVAKALVRSSEGLCLVLHRGNTHPRFPGHIDFPGGGLEHGENIVEALTREFREELGVDITIDSDRPRIIPTWNTKFDDPVLIIIYEVTLLTTPCLTDEVSNFNYFDIHEIKQEKLDSTLVDNLSKIYKASRQPSQLTHPL